MRLAKTWARLPLHTSKMHRASGAKSTWIGSYVPANLPIHSRPQVTTMPQISSSSSGRPIALPPIGQIGSEGGYFSTFSHAPMAIATVSQSGKL